MLLLIYLGLCRCCSPGLKFKVPSSKSVLSTSLDKVIPSLTEFYDTFSNLDTQLSDHSPPINTKKMQAFTNSRDIVLPTIPPYLPSSNAWKILLEP